jgi:nucleotide-binding universal stress UspA family protein
LAGADTRVTSALLEGPVVEALLGEIEGARADVVVMSTHGHGGLTRVWLGSVADALLRASEVPVLLVRLTEDETARPAGEVPAAGAGVNPRRVVVPLDGSASAEAALAAALDLARLFGSEIVLVRIVAYPVQVSAYLPDTAHDNEAVVRRETAEATRYLEGVGSTLAGSSGQRVSTRVMVSPRAAEGVIAFAADGANDLVVMATRRRRGVARAVLGSVADKVIRGSRAPVLVVPGRDETGSVEDAAAAEDVA